MMDIDRLMGNPQSVEIIEVVQETPHIKTLELPFPQAIANPGQFFMVWVPGVDEIPMSYSLQHPGDLSLTILSIGDATQKLCSLSSGDWLGIRGPFGTSFDLTCKKPLIIGGGVGMAPLRPLVYTLLTPDIDITLLIAARTKDELVFNKEFSRTSSSQFTLETATDDGSSGFKGFATEVAKEIMEEQEFDMIYTCGPELMMAGLHQLAQKLEIPFQASLERFMKCGCGVCGTCAMDPTGHLVCRDGPIFSGEQLSKFTDFGKYHRDSVGIKKAY